MIYRDLDAVPAAHYATILADPPWLERGGGVIQRGADRHYDLMATKDICAMSVGRRVSENAHLYLWVTNNFLRDGFQVMDAWGFRYITLITWAKDKIGIGQYFRGQTEHCMFGVRGSLPYRTLDDGKRAQGSTLLNASRGAHSQKPLEMYEVIERVSYGPRLELFGRNDRPGWDLWGNDDASQRPLALGFSGVEVSA